MSDLDLSQKFLFEQSPIRGQIIHLGEAYQQLIDIHNYPSSVRNLMGEFAVAASLLANSLQLQGKLSLQVKGQGQVRLIMAESQNGQFVRGIARFNDDIVDGDMLLGDGTLTITIEPDKGARYQGVVALHEGQLAKALEDYFTQSEQLKTKFWFAVDADVAAGLMIQAMPTSADSHSVTEDSDLWDRVVHLASTVKDDELLKLKNQDLLFRLYHEETVRLYDASPIEFRCGCTRERTSAAILQIGKVEADDILQVEGHLTLHCQVCGRQYNYSQDDVNALFEQQKNELN